MTKIYFQPTDDDDCTSEPEMTFKLYQCIWKVKCEVTLQTTTNDKQVDRINKK